jgi:hypothetical protein
MSTRARTAGTAPAPSGSGVGSEILPQRSARMQGGSPGDGMGGGLDAMLWGRQVELSSIISRDMGRLAGMATDAYAKDTSTPDAVDDRAGAPSLSLGRGGGEGRVRAVPGGCRCRQQWRRQQCRCAVSLLLNLEAARQERSMLFSDEQKLLSKVVKRGLLRMPNWIL